MFERKKTFFKKLRRQGLAQGERQVILDSLVLYVKKNPAGNNQRVRRIFYGSKSFSASTNFFKILYKPVFVTAIIAIIIVTGGGVAYAAEGALPGDLLYPIKIHINENVRTVIVVSPEAKIEWEVSRTERRLQEAEQLATQGRLDADTSSKISINLKSQSKKISKKIKALEASGNIDVVARSSSNLETALQAHKKIIIKMSDESRAGVNTKDIVRDLEEEEEEASRVRNNAEIEIKTKIHSKFSQSAENRKKSAQKKLDETKNYIEKWEKRLGSEATVEARTQIQKAQEIIIRGEAELNAQKSGEAFNSFQEAHRMAQQARLLLEAKKNFNVNIIGKKNTSTIEIKKDKRLEDETKKSQERGKDKDDDVQEDSNEKNKQEEKDGIDTDSQNAIEIDSKIDVKIGL